LVGWSLTNLDDFMAGVKEVRSLSELDDEYFSPLAARRCLRARLSASAFSLVRRSRRFKELLEAGGGAEDAQSAAKSSVSESPFCVSALEIDICDDRREEGGLRTFTLMSVFEYRVDVDD
jgi:hypothetical protein